MESTRSLGRANRVAMTRDFDRNGFQETVPASSPSLDTRHPISLPVPRSMPRPTTTTHSLESAKWNTQDLPWRLTSDLIAAASASLLIAPTITIIDGAIIESTSRRSPLRTSLLTAFSSLVTRPHKFMTSRPFLLISTLYFGTYLTANTIDTVSSTVRNTPSTTTSAGPAKFVATTGVNMSLCLYKDSQFARLFGAAGTVRPIPIPSFALFALRDSMTIFASFNLPPLITPLLPVSKYADRANVAQFLAPMGIQILSTPLHLLGLDLYNRPGVGRWRRWRRVGRDWAGCCGARIGRVVPAFGVGGVVNRKVRGRLLGMGE